MSQANAPAAHAYYNTPYQPYFRFNVPSHPLYCASVSNPVWNPYFPRINPYQVSLTVEEGLRIENSPTVFEFRAEVIHVPLL